MIPTQAGERFEVLDVVRGLALFGIISANMILYSLYIDLSDASKAALVTHSADRVLDYVELLLIEGKFYTIFSVLFGIGFSVVLSRGRAKGLNVYRFYARRAFFLFLIGLAHGILFWHDDILQAYAFCSALLLLFVDASDRTILSAAIVFLLATIGIKLAGGIPVGALTSAQDALFARFGFTGAKEIDILTRGSVGQIMRFNFSKLFAQVRFLVTSGMLFKIYGCFLLGLYAGRHEVYKKVDMNGPMLKRVAIVGLAVGLPLNAVSAWVFDSGSWTEILSETFGILPLSAAYVAVWCLMWLNTTTRALLRHFAPVGRMALTNYVGQSVICTLLFYGTGLGLGGTMGPALYWPIGIAIFIVQVLASRAWLARFRFGALEWIWRMLTYGEWLPLTKSSQQLPLEV